MNEHLFNVTIIVLNFTT